LFFIILLFSCDQNNNCIDADDFGDVERETIRVYAKDDRSLDDCRIPDGLTAINSYEDANSKLIIEPLKICLTKNYTIKSIASGSETYQVFNSCAPIAGKEGCLKFNKPECFTALKLCEAYCENKCSEKDIYISDAEKYSSTDFQSSVDGKLVFSSTPRTANSDFGVNITPDSQIFVSA
jgi:hypothetical protein